MKKQYRLRPQKNKKGDICSICKTNIVIKMGYRRNGEARYSNKCDACSKKPFTRNKKNYCEECGMKPISRKWLDIHHIDKNRSNNKENNLKTLCKRCHGVIHHPQ